MVSRKTIDDILEGRILALLQCKYYQLQIAKVLKNAGITISKKIVPNVKRKAGLQRNSVEKVKFSRSPPVVTQSLASKVIKQIDVENPATQRSIAESCHVSQSSITRIIKRANFIL